MSQIPRSLPVFRQDACDDGGFEEVNLNGDNDCVTPVNDFSDFNKQFPMTDAVRGPVRSKSLCYPLSPDVSSGTEPSAGHVRVFQPWMASAEEDGPAARDRAPTGAELSQKSALERTRTPSLVDELLSEIYARFGDDFNARTRTSTYGDSSSRSRASQSGTGSPDSECWTEYSTTSENINGRRHHPLHDVPPTNTSIQRRDSQRRHKLKERGTSELRHEVRCLETHIQYCMSQLTRQVKRRDRFRRRRERQSNLITAILQASSPKRSQDTRIRFSLEPFPGDPGYVQWKDAMKMVARLPEGVPEEFRKKLWVTLSEQYLNSRGVDWKKAERFCFNEWSNPDDDELGLQIVRDLHRTGCSLFCGQEAQENQLMLKRVLLAYARWNKSIGYCQGFNMLAAIILEVVDKSESDALKVMIYMIEGILPECYFTNNLRGLSVDMAVFRDLLKLRLPQLSKHLDDLQIDAREGGAGTSYEPPLTNVFTMQWFLTLFSTCLPRDLVLRVWDLILLDGNEVLLRTALAIWKGLEERILLVPSADEFYCSMGQLSQEMLEFNKSDSNRLIKDLVEISPFPFLEVSELREKYTFNITPWSQGIAVAKKGLKILYSDDEENMDEDEEKIAVAATFGISTVFRAPRSPGKAKNTQSSASPNKGPSQQNVDRERLTVDISALKQQYSKLRQRQKQAQIILSSAMTKHLPSDGGNLDHSAGGPPVAMNHLLLGKKPLVMSKPRRGIIPGSVPAPKNASNLQGNKTNSGGTSNPKSTHILRPQPEIIAPKTSSPVKRKTGIVHPLQFSVEHREENASQANKDESAPDPGRLERMVGSKPRHPHLPCSKVSMASSSTEHCVGGSDDETENATDLEELPRDLDVASLKSECESRHFAESLMRDFDSTVHEIGDEDDFELKMHSTANSEKAIQIIKENSEILEKILRKKGERGGPHLEKSLTTDETLADENDTSSRRSSMISYMSRSVSSGGYRRTSTSAVSTLGSSKPINFNPFPKPVAMRRNKEVGKKLGLYSTAK